MSPPPPEPTALLEIHGAVHAALEDAVYAVLDKLVSLDVAGAAAVFEALAARLVVHMSFEEAQVLPLYAPHAPKDGPGRLDHVAGDHTILLRHVEAVRAILAELSRAPPATEADAPAPRRAVLERLPVLYRLLGTLEHHTAREQNNVYRAIPPSDDVVAALRSQAAPLVEPTAAA